MKTTAVMTREVVVVSPAVSAAHAARVMGRLGIRHLPVVDRGRLVGILSDRDLPRRGPSLEAEATCAEAMTAAPVTCAPDTRVGRMARLMLDHKIDSLPVVGPTGDLVGLVTSTDLLWLLVDRDDEEVLPFDFHLRVAQSDGEALAGGG